MYETIFISDTLIITTNFKNRSYLKVQKYGYCGLYQSVTCSILLQAKVK